MIESHRCRIVDAKAARLRGTRHVRQGRRGAVVRCGGPDYGRLSLSRPSIFRIGSLNLNGWRLPEGGLYFVTPTVRARPAKVAALADFFIAKLTNARWRSEVVIGCKPPRRRRKQT